MEPQAIFDHLQGRLPGKVYDFTTAGTKDPYFKVKPEDWLEVARQLRDDAVLQLDFLQNVTAVDWIKQGRFDLVYHLWSYPLRHGCVVKVEVPRDKPQLPSVAEVWKAADWNEREQFDLLGVEFLGHPDLRRILMPDDWPGHPMRKDYKEAEAYRGMSTSRPSVLELLPAFDKASPEQRQPPAPGESDE
jgi:NADH-quinone oxidoreductase subunit C